MGPNANNSWAADSVKKPALRTKSNAAKTEIEVAPAKPPFQSEEDLSYTTVTGNELLSVGHSGSFIGVVVRPFAKRPELRQLEVYQLGESSLGPLEKKSCEFAVEKIIGPLKDSPYKLEKNEIFSLPTGKACQIKLADPDPDATFQTRSIYIVRLRNQTFGFVELYKKKQLPGDFEDTKQFLSGLSALRP